MRGQRIAIAVVSLCGLGGLAAPAAAQPAEEEIEMEPEAPPSRPAPAASKPAASKPAAPAPVGDPAPADGDSPPPAPVKDPKLAKKWLSAGQQLVQKGDYFTRAKRPDDAKTSYENAITAFQKSIEVGVDLATYALLADVEDKLGKHDLAATHLRVVLNAQTGIKPDVLKKATAKFDDLATKVGLVTLTVAPEGAAIALAGVEIGKAPLAEPLILMPGTYIVTLQADGFQPKETELIVEAGSESERAIELEAVKIIVQAPPVRDEEPIDPPKLPDPPSRAPLYLGGGAAVALLGTAVATGVLAVGRHGTYTSPDSNPAEREDARSSGKTFALISDLTLAGGLVAGGFTAYWYFFKYKPAQRRIAEQRPVASQAKVDVIPWVQPDASGITFAGRF